MFKLSLPLSYHSSSCASSHSKVVVQGRHKVTEFIFLLICILDAGQNHTAEEGCVDLFKGITEHGWVEIFHPKL